MKRTIDRNPDIDAQLDAFLTYTPSPLIVRAVEKLSQGVVLGMGLVAVIVLAVL